MLAFTGLRELLSPDKSQVTVTGSYSFEFPTFPEVVLALIGYAIELPAPSGSGCRLSSTNLSDKHGTLACEFPLNLHMQLAGGTQATLTPSAMSGTKDVLAISGTTALSNRPPALVPSVSSVVPFKHTLNGSCEGGFHFVYEAEQSVSGNARVCAAGTFFTPGDEYTRSGDAIKGLLPKHFYFDLIETRSYWLESDSPRHHLRMSWATTGGSWTTDIGSPTQVLCNPREPLCEAIAIFKAENDCIIQKQQDAEWSPFHFDPRWSVDPGPIDIQIDSFGGQYKGRATLGNVYFQLAGPVSQARPGMAGTMFAQQSIELIADVMVDAEVGHLIGTVRLPLVLDLAGSADRDGIYTLRSLNKIAGTAKVELRSDRGKDDSTTPRIGTVDISISPESVLLIGSPHTTR